MDGGRAALVQRGLHTIMHGVGKLGLASLCNLDQLPPTVAIVIAAPLKIVHGSPLRAIAIAPA
jgi:kynurenine formamidase